MTEKTLQVLLVEDNAGDARLLREMFSKEKFDSFELTHLLRLSEAMIHLAKCKVDIVLLDMGLPDAHGLDTVRQVHAAGPSVPLIVLTGLDDEALAAEAMKQGAQDYLIKGQIENRALPRALRYAIERHRMQEALFVEKERAQVSLNSIGDAIICTNSAGNITFLNLVAEKMTGWPLQEAADRPIAEVFKSGRHDSRDHRKPDKAPS
jgi:PleD family two-component response regulator